MRNLEFIRRTRGWSQEALAAQLGSGFTASAISMMETGRLKPTHKQAFRLAELLGLPSDVLLSSVDVDPTAQTMRDAGR